MKTSPREIVIAVLVAACGSGDMDGLEDLATDASAWSIALQPPSSVRVEAQSSSSIRVSWNDTNSLERGYSVERSLSSGSGFAAVTTTAQNVTSYLDTGLRSSTRYYYRVRAVGYRVGSSYSPVVSATTQSGACVPASEICNGRDDDCDGLVDEGFGLGAACDGPDTDLCSEGVVTCAGCSDTTSSSVDVCDGLDNDCDGTVDEGCADPIATGEPVWAIGLGGNSSRADTVVVDSDGNIIVAGRFAGSLTFGVDVLTSEGMEDIFVAKFSTGGTPVWAASLGGTSNSESTAALAVDSAGSVFVVGQFQGTLEIGTASLTSAGLIDVFVAKFSASGAPLWAKRFGGSGQDFASDAAIDATSQLIIAGTFTGTTSFGSGSMMSAGSGDAFVAKLSTTGTTLWSKRFGGSADEGAKGVAAGPTGEIVLDGVFGSSIDLGGSVLSVPGTGLFIAEFSAAGTHLWSVAAACDASCGTTLDIAVDGSGAVAVAGTFAEDIDFGSVSIAGMGPFDDDVFVAHYSTDGSLEWASAFPALGTDRLAGLVVDGAGNMVLTGWFARGPLNFGGDDLLRSSGWEDIFLAKFSDEGTHLWSNAYGNEGKERGYAVATDPADNIVLAGLANMYVTFGDLYLPLTSDGYTDGVLVKFTP